MSEQVSVLSKIINLKKWGDKAFDWQGELPIDYFSRIYEQLADKKVTGLSLSCQLKEANNVLWLNFAADGPVFLTCQRCLQPVAIELNKAHKVALLHNENQISALDDEVDYMLLAELVDESKPNQQLLPLANIIEDELLLDLPLSPKHSDCEMAVSQVGDIPEEEPENPFAALAGLKGNK